MTAPALQLYQRGLRHHEAGELPQAEAAFRQALAINPRHADSLHRLGYIAWQVGQSEAAAKLIHAALKLDPRAANYHLDLGNAYLKLGRFKDAEAAYLEAVRLRGRFPEAYANLSALMLALRRFSDAEKYARKAAKLKPDSWQAQMYLAHALRELDRIEEAEPCYRKAAALQPRNWEAHNNLGNTLIRLGRSTEALECYRTALRINPDYADGHSNLGCALRDLGQLPEAEQSFRTAIRLNPGAVDAHNNLGCVLKDQQRPAEAEEHFRTALRLKPDFAEVHNNLGISLQMLDRVEEAEACYRAALELKPDYRETHSNLADILRIQGRLAEAFVHCKAVLEKHPTFAAAHNTLGNILRERNCHEESLEAYRAALRHKPGYLDVRANVGAALVGSRQVDAGIAEYEQLLQANPNLKGVWRSLLMALLYTPNCTPARMLEKNVEFGHMMARRIEQPLPPPDNERNPNRRLRIGWLSSDFRVHPVGRNIELMFFHRDRAAFETVCYADVAKPDKMTAWFRAHSDLWRDIHGKTDAEVAEMARADKIDVMIYLAGRFDDNRPQLAAWRAAPVQISLFDGATTGIPGMDYFLADPVTVPAHPVEKFSERVLRLPNFYVHRAPMDAPPVATPPSLSKDNVAFGSFNNPVKMAKPVLELWSRLLAQSSGARLRMGYMQRGEVGRFKENILADFSPDVADRVDFIDAANGWTKHMMRYHDVDIALDPFPFNGSTTTFEALWMGVPVVTLLGDRMMSRWTASMLDKVGLDDLIARTPEEYIAIALELAADRDRLAELRTTLRERVARSLLCDGPKTTRYFERALRAVWRKWCKDGESAAQAAAE